MHSIVPNNITDFQLEHTKSGAFSVPAQLLGDRSKEPMQKDVHALFTLEIGQMNPKRRSCIVYADDPKSVGGARGWAR
jgi:hypothetical protein